jgi:hypothetical protein
MAEVTVATTTASLSTILLRAALLLGAEKMTIIRGLLLPQQHPGQKQQQRAGLGVGGDPTRGAMSQHPLLTGATFGLGFHHFELQFKTGGALLAVLSSYVAS